MVAVLGDGEVWATMSLELPHGVSAPVYSYRASAGSGTITGVVGPLRSSAEVGDAENEVLRRVLSHMALGSDAVDAGADEAGGGRAEQEDHREHE